MMQAVWKDKPTKVFIAITAFFVVNAIIAESIGGKLFSLEAVFGLQPSDFTLFGQPGLSYTLTCGVLLWPLEFVITDIVNEYYGLKAVKRISYIAVVLILYAFLAFYIAIGTPPSDFWKTSQAANGVPDMQAGFSAIFGQGMWIIFGSLVAFLLGQLVDVFVFHKIKQKTGNKHVWLRATGSTVVSQLVDSFIVLFIAFKIGNGWSWQLVLAICLINYSYKFVMAILLTPVIYFAERRLDAYLGKELAESMKQEAMMKK
ncbi:MAG: queuosine precursor transporter [Taibaiella sp.]|nr:queuosine precursor transporter [Taibaiella sp.]